MFVLSPVTGAERRLAALEAGGPGLSWFPDGQWLVTCGILNRIPASS